MEGIFNRTELLLGKDILRQIGEKKVILLGVGGVGSWCAESLVRSGIKHLTIVDSDCVSVTNVNRQLMATTRTVGLVKVDVLKERLLEINPDAEITAIQAIYDKEHSAEFHLEQYDYIIDCIDSLKDKINLLLEASYIPGAAVFSSMGAALKMDPTKVQVAEFWKVRGCPLGAAMRKRMHQNKQYLGKKVMCVFSEEVLENKGAADFEREHDHWSSQKAQINGTLPHITAIFGFTLAGLVIQHICKCSAAE